jgi:outer membrane protein insertion porin family
MDRVRRRSDERARLLLWSVLVIWPACVALGQFPDNFGSQLNGGGTPEGFQPTFSGPENIPPGSPTSSLPPPVTGTQPLPPPAAAMDAARQQTVADVRIVGNETIDIDKIFPLIRTRKGRLFDPEILQQDKRNLLTKGLFREVRIITQDTDHGVLVTFEVFERPTIHFIEFIGDRGLTHKTLLKETGLKVGDALNFYAVEEARRKVEDLYRRKGYAKIQVTIAEGNRAEDRGVVLIISEGPLQRIWAVKFTGNDGSVIPDGRLKTLIESKPGFLKFFGGKVDHEKISADIEKLIVYYRGLGYFRARIGRQIEYDANQKWLTINFVVDEGPRYVVRDVSVVGNQKFDTVHLQNQFQLKSGDYFNLDRMNSDVNAIRDIYGAQGYIFSDIKADPRFLEEPGELDLVYSIAEGQQFRVGKINVKIAGEFPHTKERVILDRLSIRPGQIVDIREIRNSERRLKSSQLFIINPSEGEPPRIVIVPPDLKDADEFLASGGSGTTRGQGPDDKLPCVDLEIHLPKSFLEWLLP